MAIELRERSPRQPSPFRDKAQHLACDRPTLGVHTPPVPSTCFWVQLVHVHACTHVWLNAHEKGLLHAQVVSLHLTFSTLMFHPSSPLSSDIIFDTAFQSLTFTDLLLGLFRPKCSGPAHFRNGEEDFGYMANMPHSTGYEPNQHDKMVPADDDATPINDPDHDSISDISKTTHENTGWFGVFTVCETSVSQTSRGDIALQKECKESQPRETVCRQREREEGEGSVISVGELMSKKSRRNSIRSYSHQTHRKFYSDERDLREHLQRRAQQAIIGKKSVQRKFF